MDDKDFDQVGGAVLFVEQCVLVEEGLRNASPGSISATLLRFILNEVNVPCVRLDNRPFISLRARRA